MLCTKESNGIIDFVRVTKVGSDMIFYDISLAILSRFEVWMLALWIFQAGMVHSELFLALVRAPEDECGGEKMNNRDKHKDDWFVIDFPDCGNCNCFVNV